MVIQEQKKLFSYKFWGVNNKRKKAMPREKRDTTVLNIKIATPTYKRLSEFCDESGLTKTLAVEHFLNKCLEEYFKKPESERKII